MGRRDRETQIERHREREEDRRETNKQRQRERNRQAGRHSVNNCILSPVNSTGSLRDANEREWR